MRTSTYHDPDRQRIKAAIERLTEKMIALTPDQVSEADALQKHLLGYEDILVKRDTGDLEREKIKQDRTKNRYSLLMVVVAAVGIGVPALTNVYSLRMQNENQVKMKGMDVLAAIKDKKQLDETVERLSKAYPESTIPLQRATQSKMYVYTSGETGTSSGIPYGTSLIVIGSKAWVIGYVAEKAGI